MAKFTDKNILVIGGSSGIGLNTVKRLLLEDANVWVASRREPEVAGVQYIPFDVENFDQAAFDKLPDKLHGLVYGPGTINLKPFQALKPEDFQRDLDINVMGAVKTLQACLKPLRKAKGASVVLFSTVAVKVGLNFHASVATAKGALEGLGKSLAAEFASKQVRVNIIAPSLTDTPLASNLLSSDEKRKSSDDRHPIGRVGTTDDIATIVELLLSDESSWITGQVLGVDGGMSTLKPL